MQHFPITGLLIAAAALAAAPSAGAAPRCGDRDAIVEQLADRYGESQRAFGLTGGRGLIEVFASDGGSWTILLTSAGGRSCLMAAGEAYQQVEPEEETEDTPA